MERFYLETSRSDDTSDITRNSKELMVLVALPVEQKRHLRVYLTKNGNKSAYEPQLKTDEYTIVKTASKDEFYRAYHTWLRCIHQVDLSNGEFYLVKKKYTPANGIAWFSDDDKRKMGLLIEFHDDKKDFHLSIDCNIRTGKNAHHFRKAGNTIEAEKFNLFFKCVLNFLHDFENYNTNYKALLEQFIGITEGEKPNPPIIPSWQVDNSIIIEKITNRISSIEKRLIELDTDVPEERVKMRGELEGLKFALRTIQNA